MKELFIVFCFMVLISAVIISGEPSVKNSETCTDTLISHDTLEGSWTVDNSYNNTAWDESSQKGISHEWFESLIIRNDSFFLEDHEWWPPYSFADGKEYFAAEFTNYIIGTCLVRKDTLLLDGYTTDYTYSTRVDSMYKYHHRLLFKLNADTLELTEYSFLKQRMIRKN